MTSRLRRLLLVLSIVLLAWVAYVATRPRHGPGYVYYRQALTQPDDPARSVALLRQAILREPASPAYHSELGTRLLQSGDYDAALAELEATAYLDPDAPHVYCQLAQCLLELRRGTEAKALVETALQKSPNCPHALATRGELALRDEDLKSALADFEAAARWDRSSAMAYQKIGYIQYQSQQYEAARNVLEQSLALGHRLPGTYALLGQTYLKLAATPHNLEQARRYLEAALSNNPEAGRVRAALGELFLREGDLAGAQREFEAAIAVQPAMKEARFGLFQVASRQGDRGAAERHQRAYSQLQRREAAALELKARAAADPTRPEPALRFVRLSLDAGAYKEADRALSKLIAAMPESGPARAMRAELYERTGQTERAVREAEIARRLHARR